MTDPAAQKTPDRRALMHAFVARAGWQGAELKPLAGDASFRRYERVFAAEKQAVLMDAPPDKEDIAPFIKIGRYLEQQGFSAPRILAEDRQNGFLLLEDLGDDSYTQLLMQCDAAQRADAELELYREAVAALARLHRQSRESGIKPDIPVYDHAAMMREVALFSDWYLPAIFGKGEKTRAHAQEFLALWDGLLRANPLPHDVVVLRDYHADNLLWLPERAADKRVGMLDFQDALIGHPAYDIVSLLEDARRDVLPQTVEAALAHYTALSGCDGAALRDACALLGAQRQVKIIGIFVRLGVRDGKVHYTGYLPRVWGHFMRDLQHPALRALRDWVEAHIPVEARGVLNLQAAMA